MLTASLILWQEAGILSVGGASVRRRLSFLDYMAGGCEIQCMITIDFSGSNPPTNDPVSCHFAGMDLTRCACYNLMGPACNNLGEAVECGFCPG